MRDAQIMQKITVSVMFPAMPPLPQRCTASVSLGIPRLRVRGRFLNTTADPRSNEFLTEAPHSYFKSIDAKDLGATMDHYAEDAVEIIMPDNQRSKGAEAIREMYVRFFDDFRTIRHDIQNLVVDPDARKVATEQSFNGEPSGGEAEEEMYNCNFFQFDDRGKLTRVIIWMSGTNPLR